MLMMKKNDFKLVLLVVLFTGLCTCNTTSILAFTTTSSSFHSNQEQQQCYDIPRINFEQITKQSIRQQQQQQKQRWRQRQSRRQYSVSDTTTDDDSTCHNECERIIKQHNQNKNNNNNRIQDLSDTTSNYNINIDRRETFFALLGTIWSVSSISIPSTILLSNPQIANAGSSDAAGAKIFIPNPYDVLLDRELSQQCLIIDSSSGLAKPECNFLYKGTDNQLLIERIQKANTAFQQIPDLVTSKKWSQITGIMTGPMGELIRTMVQLANTSSSTANQKSSKDLINVVNNDLYSLSDGVSKKDSTIVLKYHTKATSDLLLFIKSL